MIARLLLVVVAFVAACTPPRRRETPAPPVDVTRLDHAQHSHVPCDNCHRAGTSRPGKDDHQPCDNEKCHKKQFAEPPGKLCKVCHLDVTTQPLVAKMKEYPVEDPWQAMPPVFSHAKHMDRALMEANVGFHVACKDCHTRGDDALVRPNHATCTRCHAAEVGLKKAPKMQDCAGCHKQPRSRPRARPRLTDDLKFGHESHRRDAKGVAIRCEDCHKKSARSASYSDHAQPRVESCVACHDDSNRVRYERRMRICEGCHLEKTANITALAPRSHLPSTERPIDHTLAFRRDHAEAAANGARRCATCHLQMSGNPKGACDECHQRMLPADHRITYRELDHGPDAVADRSRCARCHVVEFCTACHAQRPRSHGIVLGFNFKHGQLARLNPRPCVTCHGSSFCSGDGACHTAAAPRQMR